MDATLKVVSPIGEEIGQKKTELARGLESLEGKTICEIWNGGFKADVMFPIIEKMLRERYRNVNVIPFTEFPAVTIDSLELSKKEQTLEAVRKALLAKGCDALITGNGG